MTDETPTFREAVLDMGILFREMEEVHNVPPEVTMDIVRLQLMYMQTNNQPTVENPNVEVIEGEAEEEVDE
jgi:hypothetical protein